MYILLTLSTHRQLSPRVFPSLPLMSSMENTSVIYKVNDAAVHVGRLRLKETPGFPAITR